MNENILICENLQLSLTGGFQLFLPRLSSYLFSLTLFHQPHSLMTTKFLLFWTNHLWTGLKLLSVGVSYLGSSKLIERDKPWPVNTYYTLNDLLSARNIN